jgi:hypothetical protein
MLAYSATLSAAFKASLPPVKLQPELLHQQNQLLMLEDDPLIIN